MLTPDILDNLRAMLEKHILLEKYMPCKPTITILHMLDLLELSRALRKDGIKLRRIRKGFWVIATTEHFRGNEDELHVSQFASQDQMFMFDKPDYVLKKPKLKIVSDWDTYSILPISLGMWSNLDLPDDYLDYINE